MEKTSVVVKVKPYSYQPTARGTRRDIGISGTTPEELAKSILRPVVIEEEAVA